MTRAAAELHSTSMDSDEWNKQDAFMLSLVSSARPQGQGFEGLAPILDAVEALDAEVRPDSMFLTTRRLTYSRQTLRRRLQESFTVNGYSINLARSQPPDVNLWLNTWEGQAPGCGIDLRISPFSFVREPGQAERRAGELVSFVRALASRLPLSCGLGHSFVDLSMSSTSHVKDMALPRPIQEVFWLNVYGPQRVQALGREHLLSTPSAHMEELPGGALLWLTRPTPADFDSEEARLAQARALVHLRPELSLEATLAVLRERSRVFSPIPLQFDPDVADILSWEVDFRGLAHKRQEVERFNRYRPPPVSEWVPTAQAPAPDVDDVKAAIDTYEGLYAEQLIALFHAEVLEVTEGIVEALPRLDWRLWHFGWGKNLSHEQRETLVAALGAFLGRYLVEFLGGRWVPRRKLEEAAVVVGDRAWLPFLRSRHALQGPDAPLDFSCTQLFRSAHRLAAPSAG